MKFFLLVLLIVISACQKESEIPIDPQDDIKEIKRTKSAEDYKQRDL